MLDLADVTYQKLKADGLFVAQEGAIIYFDF